MQRIVKALAAVTLFFNCANEYNVFYDVDRCGGFSVRPVRSTPKK